MNWLRKFLGWADQSRKGYSIDIPLSEQRVIDPDTIKGEYKKHLSQLVATSLRCGKRVIRVHLNPDCSVAEVVMATPIDPITVRLSVFSNPEVLAEGPSVDKASRYLDQGSAYFGPPVGKPNQ